MEIVYLHGFASGPTSQKGTYLKKALTERGYRVLLPDLNGGDFGHTTISRQLAIVDEVVQTLSGPVMLIGSSLGGYLAGLYAEHSTKVTAIVMMCPAFQFARRFLQRLPPDFMNAWQETGMLNLQPLGYEGLPPLHYEIVEDARQYEQIAIRRRLPALVIHGLEDEVVPYTLSLDYLQHNPEARLLLRHSDHALTNILPAIEKQILLFLEELSDSPT